MSNSGSGQLSAEEALAAGERGSRRKKLAGYLKAANELRQSYQNAYIAGARGFNDSEVDEHDASMPSTFPDLKVARSGEEEMVLFPSYARRHIKSETNKKPARKPANSDDGQGGPGDAEYWRREWQFWEDENAVADVDVRGWIYSPNKGPMTRKNRLLFGIARQLSGIPVPSANSQPSSRSASTHGDRVARREEESIELEAKRIEAKGQRESDIADQGGYSEEPGNRADRFPENQERQGRNSLTPHSNYPTRKQSSGETTEEEQEIVSGIVKRKSWNQPANMSPEELAIANKHLISRLKPFLTNPSVGMNITIFYYNDNTSQSRTTTTDDTGHFNFRAALNFVPTHIRVLANSNLSATEEVIITEPTGISLISDIDDTIKHSAVTAGAKEIFRNTFIRELGDLTIEGVREWYTEMADMGVKLHYVSNSPWQLYPVLVSYFASAGLPPGSFHLKYYTGMLQGIFEPVAERKKGTLDRLMHDFPERRFILVGDSGEADLELYTDVAIANPGKILGIFIRDVTTSTHHKFFDSSLGPLSGVRGGSARYDLRAPKTSDLRPSLPPRPQTTVVTAKPKEPEEDLMSFTDDEDIKPPRRYGTDPISSADEKKTLPTRPAKPHALRSMSNEIKPSYPQVARKAAPQPPPKPRQMSSSSRAHPANNVHSPVSQTVQSSKSSSRDSSTERYSYRSAAKSKVTSAYNALPSVGSYWNGPSQTPSMLASPQSHDGPRSSLSTASTATSPTSPPTVPPRRNLSSYPAAVASYASSKLWSSGGGASGSGGDESDSGEAPPSKREEMWRRRWARAKEILDQNGIMLRAWRVGEDVEGDAIRLIQEAARKNGWKLNEKKGGDEKGSQRKK